MNKAEIRELVKKVKQVAPQSLFNTTFKYVDIASIDRESKKITDVQILSVDAPPSRARKLIQTGDVLVSTVRPNLNAVAIVPKIYNGEIASTGFCVLRPRSESLDSVYLYYFSQTKTFVNSLVKIAIGASYPAVSDDNILDIEIPLPPLAEQRRIAAILAKADRLRRLRRYALELSAGYLQAVFVEMFGDPLRNPKDFPLTEFGDICETRLGKMLDAKQQTGLYKRLYLRNENVQWGRFDLTKVFEMDFDEKDRAEFRLRKGDVLICEGGEVGRSAIWKDELPECYYQKALHRVRPKPKLANSEFIFGLMLCLAKFGGLGDFTSQVTIAHLTGEKLKTIVFPLPPLQLQQQFAEVVHKLERLRAQQEEAARQAEHLFQTLLQRAFRGELSAEQVNAERQQDRDAEKRKGTEIDSLPVVPVQERLALE